MVCGLTYYYHLQESLLEEGIAFFLRSRTSTVRHGPVVGIHNGIITNDDELLDRFECSRAEPRMTVDSEAIFALAAHSENDARAFERLRGAMATAWLDERAGSPLFLARYLLDLSFVSMRITIYTNTKNPTIYKS